MTKISRRGLIQGGAVAAAAAEIAGKAHAQAGTPTAIPDFSINHHANIVEEDHFGVINGFITAGVNYRDSFAIRGLFAPPYASSDFALDVRLFGEKVPAREYVWRPVEVRRQGAVRGIAVSSTFVLAAGQRAGVLAITLHNTTGQRCVVPVQFDITGSFDSVHEWHFARPRTDKRATGSAVEGRAVVRGNAAGAYVIATELPGLRWEPWSSHWEGRLTLAAGESARHYVVIAMGPAARASETSEAILRDPVKALDDGRADFAARTRDLFAKLPRLEASDARLVTYYNRSLVHFLLNQWRVPEFILNPYYSTGSIKGGCVGNYLWDFGGPYELFPLFDPAAAREHIKQFLRIDITKHFLFNPLGGKADGPWYPVNQEKIIWLVYHYVLHTGDLDFLRERVNDKTVLDWIVYHASFRDDFSKPAVLVNYGKGNNHLELRTKYRYDDYMPDLNGRRYMNYMLAHSLATMAGQPQSVLAQRAESLKPFLKSELWSTDDKWFWFRYDDGRKELRYTVQMFKMIGSPVLDQEELEGLISHLNEEEFLSEFGLHSISKKDPAYDQVDIDAGGGGNYVAFTPRIAELLYRAGYPEKAEDLLRRTLWWGERTPYWCDSFVANQVEYRKDTPLQNAFDATCGAQCVIFGMFGVRVAANGNIHINPRPPAFSPSINLRGVRVRGASFDVFASRDRYEVTINGKSIRSRVGVPVVLKAEERARVR